MTPSDQRKKLHTYIADLDDKKITAMLTLLEDEIAHKTTTTLSEKQKKEIRRREKKRISGKSKTFTFNEAKKMFRNKK